jgi:hypothetical protein
LPFCIPGMTFFTPILAVLRIPQQTFLAISRHHSGKSLCAKHPSTRRRSFQVYFPGDSEPAMLRRVYGGILQRLPSIPGVKAAGTTNSVPLEPFRELSGQLVGQAHSKVEVSWPRRVVFQGDYFEAMNIPLVAGGSSPKVIVSQMLRR